jgi:antitoxin (DNA-binding transcriptional repressor) of toxin-antitoxin stability system
MKVMALREAKQQLSGCVVRSQRERVLITKQGRPAALMIGVEGHDLEDVLLMQNPPFWKMKAARRAGEATPASLVCQPQVGVGRADVDLAMQTTER